MARRQRDAAAEAPEIAAPDISMFGPADFVNLILQRSEIIADQPRRRKIVGPGRTVTTRRPAPLRSAFCPFGFHYPIETYLILFREAVGTDGAVIVDSRARQARAGAEILGAMGEVALVEHSASGNGRRLLLRKGGR